MFRLARVDLTRNVHTAFMRRTQGCGQGVWYHHIVRSCLDGAFVINCVGSWPWCGCSRLPHQCRRGAFRINCLRRLIVVRGIFSLFMTAVSEVCVDSEASRRYLPSCLLCCYRCCSGCFHQFNVSLALLCFALFCFVVVIFILSCFLCFVFLVCYWS